MGCGAIPKPNVMFPLQGPLHRVVTRADPAALEKVLTSMAVPRLPIGRGIAAEGKRINGAHCNSTDHYGTVVWAEHGMGLPVDVLGNHEKGRKRAAMHALFEKIPCHGRVMTIDALHTVRTTAHLIVQAPDADYMMTVKENARETCNALATMAWDNYATGWWQEDLDGPIA